MYSAEPYLSARKACFLLFCLVLYYYSRPPQDDVERIRAYRGLETIDKLAAAGGYSASHVEVITEDGYGLWLHRIGNNTGTPVLLQHGFMFAADSLILRANISLAFVLLEHGYDVWLANHRGTVYNEFHLKYNRSQREFWDYSFHEIAYYDLPANIDKVLKLRKVEQLHLIGLSLGSTEILVMGSIRPEYNKKVKTAVLLSPFANARNMDQIPTGLVLMTYSLDYLYSWSQFIGYYEILFRNSTLLRTVCTWTDICLSSFCHTCGDHMENYDLEEFEGLILAYWSGTSFKMPKHMVQSFKSDSFSFFDYGEEQNLHIYNSSKPPEYPLELMTAPVALLWGANDPLITPASIGRLASRLPNLIVSKLVPDPLFTHLDPIIGKNLKTVLYPLVIDILDSFERKNCTDIAEPEFNSIVTD